MLELKKAQSKSTKLTSSSPMLRTNKNTNFFSFIYQTFAKWFNILWIKTGKLIWGCSTGFIILVLPFILSYSMDVFKTQMIQSRDDLGGIPQ